MVMVDNDLAELQFKVRRIPDVADAVAALVSGLANLVDDLKTEPLQLHDLAVTLRRGAEDLAQAALANTR